MQLSDLFEDDEGEDETIAVAHQPTPVESSPSTPAAAGAPVAVAPVVEEEEVEVAAVVDEDTPEGQFVKLSADTGGVLTLDGLLG